MGRKYEKILWGRIFQNKIIFKIPLALLIIAYFWRARRYEVFMFSNWGMYDSFFSFRFISTILNQKRNCSYATLEELTDEENQSDREEPYLLSLCIMNRQWASIDPCLTANSKKIIQNKSKCFSLEVWWLKKFLFIWSSISKFSCKYDDHGQTT